MKMTFLRIFQTEIKRQCKFAIIANNDLFLALKTGDVDRLWYSVQSFLVATGNLSKLLWPSKSSLPNRGVELRQSLSINDNSPLAPRTFRNHFEHFDERLERWIVSSRQHIFVDSNIGPQNMIGGVDKEDYIRNFDTTNSVVTFRGDLYYLKPVIEAVQELWEKAVIESQKPKWSLADGY